MLASQVAVPEQIVDTMRALSGHRTKFRAAHAKGIVGAGSFIPAPDARRISRAAHFAGRPIPVAARFSNGPLGYLFGLLRATEHAELRSTTIIQQERRRFSAATQPSAAGIKSQSAQPSARDFNCTIPLSIPSHITQCIPRRAGVLQRHRSWCSA